MKSLIFTLAFICLTLSINAQCPENITTLFETTQAKENSENDLLFVVREPVSNNIDQVKWQPAILIDYKNQAHKVKGYYNAAADEMQILLKDSPKTIFPQKIKAIKVGKMIFAPYNFANKEQIAYGYFQLLSENKINLLQRYETNGDKIQKSFYTCREDNPAQVLKLNRKCVLKVIDDKATAEYLKSGELNVKKENDLLQVFDYYNGNLE